MLATRQLHPPIFAVLLSTHSLQSFRRRVSLKTHVKFLLGGIVIVVARVATAIVYRVRVWVTYSSVNAVCLSVFLSLCTHDFFSFHSPFPPHPPTSRSLVHSLFPKRLRKAGSGERVIVICLLLLCPMLGPSGTCQLRPIR